jgi:hypothetical protein
MTRNQCRMSTMRMVHVQGRPGGQVCDPLRVSDHVNFWVSDDITKQDQSFHPRGIAGADRGHVRRPLGRALHRAADPPHAAGRLRRPRAGPCVASASERLRSRMINGQSRFSPLGLGPLAPCAHTRTPARLMRGSPLTKGRPGPRCGERRTGLYSPIGPNAWFAVRHTAVGRTPLLEE